MPWVTPESELTTSIQDSPDSYVTDNFKTTPDSISVQNDEVPLSAAATAGQDSGSDLDQWLQDLGRKFKTLSLKERNQTLDYLISISDGSQLYHLSKQLHVLLRRDFLSLLPEDLSVYLVGFLGVQTMITCTLVCKRWRDIIHRCHRAWRVAAHDNGVNFEGRIEKTCVTKIKESYLAASWYKKQLQAGKAFDTSVMYGHRDRVMALYYHNGVIATGSDDHTVRLWNCTTGVCSKILRTHSTVATVKFDESRIVTGSFNSKAVLWDLQSDEAVQEYVGHIAAVFCVDYDVKLGVLVTGSADNTVHVWLLSCAVCILVLAPDEPHFNDCSLWVTEVALHWTPGERQYSVVRRDEHTIHMWRMSSGHSVITDKSQELMDPEYGILVSGLQVCGPLVTYAMYRGPKYTVLQLDLDKPDTPLIMAQFTYHEKVPQVFLGCGRYFTIFLHAAFGGLGESSEMTIISNITREMIATIPMPSNYREAREGLCTPQHSGVARRTTINHHTYKPSKRGATYTLGDRTWLDGFTPSSNLGVHLVTCLRDNGILQLRWRQLPRRPESDSDSADEGE